MIQSLPINFAYNKRAFASLALSCELEINSKGKVLELIFDLENFNNLWLEKRND